MTQSDDDHPAALGGRPLCAEPFPTWPQWDADEGARLAETLASGAWWHGDGAQAMGFARDFAAMQGAAYGLPMTNGTHTIEAALAACDIGEGDEVIVPGITFIASASVMMLVLTGYSEFSVIPRMEADRLSLGGDVATAPLEAPVRRHFERLHKVSVRVEGVVLIEGLMMLAMAGVHGRDDFDRFA